VSCKRRQPSSSRKRNREWFVCVSKRRRRQLLWSNFATLQLLARSIAAPSAHRIRVLTTHIIANDSLLCSANGCLLLLIVVRSRSTSGLKAWIFFGMLVVIATSLCEYARKLASLFGARTASIKLKLQGAARIVASGHDWFVPKYANRQQSHAIRRCRASATVVSGRIWRLPARSKRSDSWPSRSR
jgi:hypothetical protein